MRLIETLADNRLVQSFHPTTSALSFFQGVEKGYPLSTTPHSANHIHWYPGHIAKYERRLNDLLKLVDVVVEVLDCRIPLATTNVRLESKIRHKPTLIILNKSDLGDVRENRRWQAQLTGGQQRAILYDAKQGQGKLLVTQNILELGEENMLKLIAKGRKRRPIRVLVAGMPNVGKSTLINSIVGRKKVKTGHRAGVTTGTSWIRIHPEIELMDSPGIIPPVLEDQESAWLLATVSSVGDAAFDDEETALYLMDRIERFYPGMLSMVFKIPQGTPLSLEAMAIARNYKLPGDSPDRLRMAQAMLTDFRNARIGRVSLEHVNAPNNPVTAEVHTPVAVDEASHDGVESSEINIEGQDDATNDND